MKSYLLENIHCPDCSGNLDYDHIEQRFICSACGHTVPAQDGIPLFSVPPEGIVPSEKLERGPDVGTPWRRANWRFLAEQINNLDDNALILDVGAGRGDFADAFTGHPYLSLDVYPYPEIDIVCDLTLVNPFQHNRFEAIALMNVMEHVYNTHALLEVLSGILKPGGVLIVAIPFLVKIHQAPVDFVRYTHYALEQMGKNHGMETALIEGYYDPVFFLEEGIGNIRNAVLPTIQGNRRYVARIMLSGINTLANSLRAIIGEGTRQPPLDSRSKAPTGYHVVYRKSAP